MKFTLDVPDKMYDNLLQTFGSESAIVAGVIDWGVAAVAAHENKQVRATRRVEDSAARAASATTAKALKQAVIVTKEDGEVITAPTGNMT